ncbi:MAG: ABC transporter ATP-binding protein [Cytophagales bacterium]|jgi:lipopolysaccharide transport system ATP-binding protein|nr:ABC transporter ATP-binding protein [Cytophagales bacterium]MCA6389623.1 ABC transporter ATP-binding protein [Cytophagales bacterium]MCA6389756.1 ABC transporter ATP-binding protein [Cytophagales bacterium]MCA6393728.1 ABC transporter ATP-binding protein [Cytophagales bacterium]MCA6397812.1 ABC transporter ATP-binding protein [Cytophagales bacterium]
MKPILEIQSVSKKYRIQHLAGGYLSLRERMKEAFMSKQNVAEDFWALKDVSFEVQAGESIGIIGRNGAGKSTLLKILSKITPPTTGRIVSRGRIASLLEVGTGFHPELTGRENIFFNGSLLGMKRIEIAAKFDEIVDFSGVEKFLDTPLKHYSSGMQLRLAFAVAAFLEPEILIIDEVLAVGDAEFQKKCLGKMEDVSKSGRTILFVSHNMAAVNSLCSSGILLKDGAVQYAGEIKNAIELHINGDARLFVDKAGLRKLSRDLNIESITIETSTIRVFDEFRYSFCLVSKEPNPITGLALLVYSELNERIGIIDLRNNALVSKSSSQKKICIEGSIYDFSLIEGNYKIGLYLSSALYQGEVHDLIMVQVTPPPSEVLPYEKQYRGLVEFKHKFSIC